MHRIRTRNAEGKLVTHNVPTIFTIKDCKPKIDSLSWGKNYEHYYEIPYSEIGDSIAENLGIDLNKYGYVIEYGHMGINIVFIEKEVDANE